MKITKLLTATMIVALGTVFANCSNNTKGTNTTADSAKTSTNTEAVQYNGKMAFIRMDTLMNQYGLFIDLNDELNKKGKAIEAELANRGRSIEREVSEYQTKAQKGLVTRFEQQTIEEGLQKKQQQAMQYRDNMMMELQKEQNVMSNKISTTIKEFLEEYNKEKGYSMIIQTMGGNPVIIADPALDITEEIVAELNKRYLETRAKEKQDVKK